MSSANHWINSSSLSLRDTGTSQLRALGAALAWPAVQIDRAVELFERMTAPWGSWPVGVRPPWPSDISDDGTPFELSLAFREGAPRLRMLVEAQRLPITPTSRWEAGRALSQRLAGAGADLTPFERVCELFAPLGFGEPRFQLWHAVDVAPGGAHLFKAYLDPEVLGAAAAEPLVAEALRRLGLPDAPRFLSPRLAGATPGRLCYFSVDLVAGASARAKVYVAYAGASRDIQHHLDGCANVGPDDGPSWLRALTGSDGPYRGRPILACFAFRSGTAPELTLHVPVRDYVAHDAEALERVLPFLAEHDRHHLERAVHAIARRRLDAGRGLLAYASLRRRDEAVGVTTYLAPELYGVTPPRMPSPAASRGAPPGSATRLARSGDPPRPAVSVVDVQGLIARQRALIAEHPFLARLERAGDLDPAQARAQARRVGKRLAFFVMGFQDLLRLTADLCEGTELGAMTRQHADEDAGHERWYLADLAHLGISLDVDGLFAEEHCVTRDVTHAVMAEVIRARHAVTRLAVVLALEACAGEFFPRIHRLFARLGEDEGLQYFGARHRQAEEGHQLGEAAAQERLAAIEVSHGALAEIHAAVDRTFHAMRKLAENLESALGGEHEDPPP